ncbi:MAG TPA: DUF3761 domain-containing protein [Candidatus Dormibacteraeota bacterium]|nr:DUF3761 domain-containing protein [Candidatus Dormibacteraeota bacterium]
MWRLAVTAGLAVALVSCGPGEAPPQAGPRSSPVAGVEVTVGGDGPWVARLVAPDDSAVESVVFWVRDASHRWRSSPAVDSAPFEAPIDWWSGDNAGAEVVTAHVTLRTGEVLEDPGGWRWVDGRQASPGGSTDVYVNADGSASAVYRPATHAALIDRVEFWLRGSGGRWTRAGSADTAAGGAYTVVQLDGTQKPGWSTGQSAVSVHVLWRQGAQFVDPAPWVESYRFQTSPTMPPFAEPGITPTPSAPLAPPPASAPPDDPYPEATTAGASAVCQDGTWSFERTLSQVCARHGGVRWWTGVIGSRGPGQR